MSGVYRLPDGRFEKEIDLGDLPIPVGVHDGAIVGFHPAPTPIMVMVKGLPAGGNLRVCSADLDGTFNSGGCTLISSGSATTVRVAHADGLSHVAITLAGTWATPVTVPDVAVTYEAVDDFLNVEFPPTAK